MTWKALLPYGIIAALVIALVLTCGDESPEPILSDETRGEIERLRGDSAEYVRTIDSLKARSAANVDTSRIRREAASRIAQLANRAAQNAERARAAVVTAETARDSANQWQTAYEERTREATQLRNALDTLELSRLALFRALALSNERADTAESRARQLEALNARILADVAKAERGCQILGIVRCPTRKESFVIGAVLGAGGALVATVAMK